MVLFSLFYTPLSIYLAIHFHKVDRTYFGISSFFGGYVDDPDPSENPTFVCTKQSMFFIVIKYNFFEVYLVLAPKVGWVVADR